MSDLVADHIHVSRHVGAELCNEMAPKINPVLLRQRSAFLELLDDVIALMLHVEDQRLDFIGL